MPYLVDIQTSFPKNYYSQEQVKKKLLELWKDEVRNIDRVEKILDNVLVEGRHLAMNLEDYFQPSDFGKRNDHFISSAVNLATNAISELCQQNDLKTNQVSSLWSNTVTGFAIPSLEARVMNRLTFSNDTKRIPLMGLGCMAGVSGINRVCDYLKGAPTEAAIFFSVELCSLTLQTKNFSLANIVSTCLFGDGAAAVLIVGDDHPLAEKAKLEFIGSKSAFFPGTEDMMGWQVDQTGLNVQLSKSVPQITEEKVPTLLSDLLSQNNVSKEQVHSYFAHPGGPKVLLAMEKALGLGQGDLAYSWDSLREKGNMSSVSVLDITARQLNNSSRSPNEISQRPYSVSVAMGPAFSSEMGLFKWN
jgi:alkylresorcinol/alkylpyrone synthase